MTGKTIDRSPQARGERLFRRTRNAVAASAVVCMLIVVLIDIFERPSSSAPAPGDAGAACARLAPLIDASQREALAVIGGQAAAPTTELLAMIADLKSAERLAPASWRPDIATQYQVLQQLADARGEYVQVHLDSYLDAATRLTEHCAELTTPRP